MEKNLRISLLLDFYGSLLTPRQEEALRLYYEEDLSLGEMAETWQISRAAVHDLIQRGTEALEAYEERLGLVKRYQLERRHLEAALGLLQDLEERLSGLPDAAPLLEGLRRALTEIEKAMRVEGG